RVRDAGASAVHLAGDVGVPGAVDGDRAPVVLARAAEIRRIEDGAGGRELRDEDVRAPAEHAAVRRRKVRRACRAGQINVPGALAREVDLAVEGHPGLVAGAAEIRQVGDHGVDDEPSRPVVHAEPETDYAL